MASKMRSLSGMGHVKCAHPAQIAEQVRRGCTACIGNEALEAIGSDLDARSCARGQPMLQSDGYLRARTGGALVKINLRSKAGQGAFASVRSNQSSPIMAPAS